MSFLSGFISQISEEDWSENRWKFVTFPCVFVVDLVLSLLMYGSVHGWQVCSILGIFLQLARQMCGALPTSSLA
jgi:hypothetical protein